MKMNINHVFDHDEGHYTSLVKMGSYHKNKNEENWDGFYCSFHYKLAKKYHLTPKRISNLWEKYCDDRWEAFMDDAETFMSFDDWLSWNNIID